MLAMHCPHCGRVVEMALLKLEHAERLLARANELISAADNATSPTAATPPRAQQQQTAAARLAEQRRMGDVCKTCQHWKSAHRSNPGRTPASYDGPCAKDGCDCGAYM